MAAFSTYQDNNMNPFLVDPVYLKIMSGLFMEDESNMAMKTNCFSQIYPQAEPVLQETSPCGPVVHEISNCLDHSSKVALSHDDDEHSVTRKQSSESSTVVDKLESGEQVTQKLSPIEKKRKTRNGSWSGSGSRSSPNSAQSKDAREEKGKKKQKQCNGEAKEKQQQQQKAKADKKDQKKTAAATTKQQEPPTGYIHVRARRGQATDSHSLAERVRREKISERMQTLQRLVPGCDKVTGKALMLDEIINYVQSLQNQVDFLSMKLASVNPMFYDFSLEQDSFMDFNPEERLNSMHASPLPQCSPNQPIVFADTQPSSYNNPVDTSAFSQDNASLLWDAEEEQGEKFPSPSGFNDNLCSFK